ncbi:sigma-70 family RNA polymerase sigma factor [Streptococcus sp. X16XC17]|nr:sigma-70 family RNA polymerase sigma factor [Streptococcus sp. X16XC17]
MRFELYEKESILIADEIVYYLRKSGASPEDSWDVTQDVLVNILESQLILSRDKIRARMYRVAIRHYIDRYRREKRYQEILQREFFKENLIQFDQEDTSELYHLLGELPEKYRLVMDLYYFQDFTVKEMSHILSISQSKVKMDLLRGWNQLKKIIKERGLTYEDLI